MSFLHTSKICAAGGIPALNVDGKVIPAAAYMSYFNERAKYKSFAKAGYKLFSVPVYFAGRSINVTTDISPFRKGIFDDPENPYWDEFTNELDAVISVCPDAMIFPRVNIMMSQWWEDSHPDELNYLDDKTVCRESFSSDVWRHDAGVLLTEFIKYIEKTPYAANIIGFHIANGTTEEWFHFGYGRGGLGKCSERGFLDYLKRNKSGSHNNSYLGADDNISYYNENSTGDVIKVFGASNNQNSEIKSIPDFSVYDNGKAEHNDFPVIKFIEYTNDIVADSICYFASLLKKLTGGKLAVGTFYGYTLEICDGRFGTHALKKVLECPDIDFISSPVSYLRQRTPGIDAAYMGVYDSILLHGKLYMAENDNRTHLTRPLEECRKNSCVPGTYRGGVWEALPDLDTSLNVLRNAFARNITHGAGFWWFDMWGGWYEDKKIMEDMKIFRKLLEKSLEEKQRSCATEVAVIVSEQAYRYTNPKHPDISLSNGDNRIPLGFAGAPYDVYDIYDLWKLPAKKYKCFIFLRITNFYTEAFSFAANYPDKLFLFNCGYDKIEREENIRYTEIVLTPEILRSFYREAGVHVYIETNDVIHAGGGYVALHAASAGVKEINLPDFTRVEPVLPSGKTVFDSKITDEFKLYETKIYRVG